MQYRILLSFLAGIFLTSSSFAANPSTTLLQQPGFFRFSFDDIKMPNDLQNVGLLGMNYFADITPLVYGGIGVYGSVTGTQGGLFVLGFEGGVHYQFIPHWWGDAGLYVGGGGGRSSYVGGGLMVRPHLGIEYDWNSIRLGLHYSYIDFPSGLIHSSQIGLDLDIPWDFYYVAAADINHSALFNFDSITLPHGKYLGFQRNDFALILQGYRQTGSKNVDGDSVHGTIGLIGAELDHYLTEQGFWYMKSSGAFSGNPNGYMDILAGIGYHWLLGTHGIALVPQFGIGAGGGGKADTGGGVLIQPQLGIEFPLTNKFATRLSGGYLWSPKGSLRAYTATGEIIYHLDFATGNSQPSTNHVGDYDIRGWRIQLFNQTYLHPQRSFDETTSAINLVAVQIDQLFTPIFFFSYQAASAYSGYHAGGLATGMIGPGLQTPPWMSQRIQLYTELLVGTGGGGGLALGGGALIEPVVGLHYALTPALGIQASYGQVKALHNNLNTPAVNVGLTLRFGTIERA